MTFYARKMTLADAGTVAAWKYPGLLSYYNLDRDTQHIRQMAEGDYRAVLDSRENLIGFWCFGKDARITGYENHPVYTQNLLDIGFGLNPDFTGQKLGLPFVKEALAFANDTYGTDRFRLSVAAFNKRAVSLYKKTGFHVTGSLYAKTRHGTQQYLVMATFKR